MNTTRLYTEEQVINALRLAHSHIKPLQYILDTLTPIELPSDEEIVQKSKEEPNNSDIETSSRMGKYVAGAIWMRNKIQGGNK